MVFTAENILLIGSILIFVSIVISKTGYRFGVPTLLLFLLVGMLFGSDGLGLQFNSASDAQFVGMIALSIILFGGGLETKVSDIKTVIGPGLALSTLGVVLTTLITGLFIYYISGWDETVIYLPLVVSMLLAATMSSTDSASVFSILRSQNINLKNNLRPMLELESGSNDPMAYMLTIALIQVITADDVSISLIVRDLVVQFFFGAVIGYGLGKISAWIINRINLSNSSLYPILLLSLVFFTFTITDLLKGNGYLAVYIAGIVVGNTKLVNKREICTFMDGMIWLFQIVLFIMLGLLVNPHEMLGVAWEAFLIGLFMMFVARPLSVFVSLLPFRKVNVRSKLFVSWVGLRGAVPIIFATYPVIAEINGSQQLFNIVFFITLLSLVVQGTTIAGFARRLHIDLPEEEPVDNFGVEIPENVDSQLQSITLTQEMMAQGNRLADMSIPRGMLVMLVKRNNEFIIPNGQLELKEGDRLLIISEKKEETVAGFGK